MHGPEHQLLCFRGRDSDTEFSRCLVVEHSGEERRSKVDMDDGATVKEDEFQLEDGECRAALSLRQVVGLPPSVNVQGRLHHCTGRGALCALRSEVRIMLTEQYKVSFGEQAQKCHRITASFVSTRRRAFYL